MTRREANLLTHFRHGIFSLEKVIADLATIQTTWPWSVGAIESLYELHEHYQKDRNDLNIYIHLLGHLLLLLSQLMSLQSSDSRSHAQSSHLVFSLFCGIWRQETCWLDLWVHSFSNECYP